jgi:CHAT domain-containing protein
VLGLAYMNRQLGDRAENVELAIAAGEEALGFLTREMSEEHWVGLQVLIANAYMARVRGDRADNLEKVTAAHEAALTVLTRDGHPNDWPHTQANLGNAYMERIRGDRADNVEKALAAYEAAFTVFTRDGRPQEWAQLQINLSNAYVSRVRGDHADNLEKAIAACEAALTVLTREGQRGEWAMAQTNLGNAYGARVRGDRASNQEKAIAASEAALTVHTREASPIEWAKLQHNRATAYALRVHGDRADNAEKAVAGHEAALTILTRESRPREWAQTQSRLALAYAIRIRGERAANQERAIAASEAALTVFTRESQPREWADTHFNLASIYLDRVSGESADNAEKAVASLEAALTVRTREALPRDWAHAQRTLAGAYVNLDRGNRAGNLEKAIDAYEAALTILTREALPDEWADVQFLLSIAYEKRLNGDKSANLRQAIAAAEAALTVRTRAARPHDHLLTARLLGQVLLEAKDWRRAGVAYANARDTFLLLFGQGVNEADAGNLIAEAGYMFAQAAYAAVERGERLGALALASEGRGRLMNAALKVQALDLPADKRVRLDELRAAIRLEEHAAQSAEGTGRAAAIDKLSGLRQELLGLVKDGSAIASTPEATVAAARRVAGNGGALVVPILTHVGTKILIATGEAAPAQSGDASDPAASASPRSQPSRPSVTVLHLPELTVRKVVDSLFEPYRPDRSMNWRLAYAINHMSPDTQERLWPKWLAAIEDLGPELWRLLGGRIDAALTERGVKRGARIIWMPPGILGTVPLGLAQDPKSKRRLIDSYEIVYAPSLEAIASAQSQIASSAPATLAAVVNPTGDLAGSEKEGQIVASHFPATARAVLERDAATSGAVLAALKGKSHWHFASHGTFSWDDARQSALVMHGMERLSVGRLLEADGLGRPRLVVLSACETGLSGTGRNPDEFIGLPGTFMALGASGVLATMWPVEDTATSLVMAKFYELHMGAKLSPPTALRRAQLWLRQATSGELRTYARDAAHQGRLESRHVAEIDRGLSEEGLKRSRNAATVEWIARNGAESTRRKKATPYDAERLARPYAHPYFWAGFTYTGL